MREAPVKALFCTVCFDIRALDPRGDWTHCRCGNVSAKWLDSARGTVSVQAGIRDKARIIGFNNQMLQASVEAHDNEGWKRMHDEATDAKGYIFDKAMRGCWACILRVSETGDITWEPDEPPQPST